MTTDPKAPLPDDVKMALIRLRTHDWYGWVMDDGTIIPSTQHVDTLRAHITAQAEKIAKLEAENKRLREENKKVDIQAGINIGLVKASCKNTAYAMKKVRLLQEGLAEAINALVEMRKEHKYVHVYSDKMKKLAALAQTAEPDSEVKR